MQTEDIVIIGGGLGGLIAAKTLAENRISPLLLEKNKYLCQKPCGEFMYGSAYGFLISDFFSEDDLYNQGIIEKRFDKIIINFCGKNFLTHPRKKGELAPSKVFTINKKKFHEYLAERAKENGARIITGKGVIGLERKKDFILINNEIKAKLIIGADGFHSVVRKFVGEQHKSYIFALSAYARMNYKHPCIFFDPKLILSCGLAWVFPQKDTCNVGVGGLKIEKVRTDWARFIKAKKIKPENLRGAFIPNSLPSKSYFDNIMLVGEAASMVDLFEGAGINTALVSGYLAAQTAKEALENNRTDASFLKKYEKEWRKRMYKDLLRSYIHQKVAIFLINHKTMTSLYLKLKHKEIKRSGD